MTLFNSLTRYTLLYQRLTCLNKWCIFSKISSQATSNSQIPDSPNQTFSAIFFFPYIRAISLVNRLKIYQFSATAFAIPLSVTIHFAGIVPGIHAPTISAGIAGCISFYVAGIMCTDIIGAVYINKNDDSVKISYVDLWGKRTDAICSISDVGPLVEPGKGLTKMFHYVEVHSLKKTFKICLEAGDILDLLQFEKVFYKTRKDLKSIE